MHGLSEATPFGSYADIRKGERRPLCPEKGQDARTYTLLFLKLMIFSEWPWAIVYLLWASTSLFVTFWGF